MTAACANCSTSDEACLSEARVTGATCCRQCREWPMHEPCPQPIETRRLRAA